MCRNDFPYESFDTPFSRRAPEKLNQAAGLVLTPSTLAPSRWTALILSWTLERHRRAGIETQAALADFQPATRRRDFPADFEVRFHGAVCLARQLSEIDMHGERVRMSTNEHASA